MKERPILLSAPMVRAILDGRKTQTRRIVKHQPLGVESVYRPYPQEPNNWQGYAGEYMHWYGKCPFGQEGDRLWVREAFHFAQGGPVYDAAGGLMDSMDDEIIYRASRPNAVVRWTPSIHMPRWASRITLEITGVRVERLQDISERDAWAEGCEGSDDDVTGGKSVYSEFAELWMGTYGHGSWDANPWVWVVEFKLVLQGAVK